MSEIIIRGPRSSSDTSISTMRVHEMAVQYWLNNLIQVSAGYPVPVIFAPVMDAYGELQHLWKNPNNPFRYLLELKDENGSPLYEPYPGNARYPLLSVQRKSWTFRNSQNYTLHPERIYGWQTDVDNPTRNDMSYVVQRQRPMAWDLTYQIDFLCLRPDTQAYFVEVIMGEFWRSGGPEPQTWIKVPYPGWFGHQPVRVRLSGGVQNMTPEAAQPNAITEYRTSMTIVVEGYKLDSDFDVVPAFWTLVENYKTVPGPSEIVKRADLRHEQRNSVFNQRLPPNVPLSV